MTKRKPDRIVYSTDPDFQQRCSECGQHPCVCPPSSYPPPQRQTARIRRERRSKGKVVTVVADLQLAPEDASDLLKSLKSACGAGGTLKDGNLELQGDHREKVMARLLELGYKAKLAGG